MKKLIFISCFTLNCFSMVQEQKKVIEIEEVFTPIEIKKKEDSEITEVNIDPNMILDINSPEVQEVIRKVVSASIHEAFKNKQLEKELADKKRCCTSSTKLKIALLTALSSAVTAIATIVVNNQ